MNEMIKTQQSSSLSIMPFNRKRAKSSNTMSSSGVKLLLERVTWKTKLKTKEKIHRWSLCFVYILKVLLTLCRTLSSWCQSVDPTMEQLLNKKVLLSDVNDGDPVTLPCSLFSANNAFVCGFDHFLALPEVECKRVESVGLGALRQKAIPLRRPWMKEKTQLCHHLKYLRCVRAYKKMNLSWNY